MTKRRIHKWEEMAVKHAAISAAIALLTAHVKFIRGSEIVESTYEGQHKFI